MLVLSSLVPQSPVQTTLPYFILPPLLAICALFPSEPRFFHPFSQNKAD